MLLTDMHIHSNFSDGVYSIPEIIDIYGDAGFNAIAITDHLIERQTLLGNIAFKLEVTITKENCRYYFDIIEEERKRARRKYGMLVIPGYEITKNYFSPHESSHIVALNVNEYISADDDALDVLKNIRSAGGFSIAAHPLFTRRLEWQTFHLWSRRYELKSFVDAWEAGNGCFLSNALIETGLPVMANSDFHTLSHLTSWKTLIDSKCNTQDILHAIASKKINFIYYHAKQRNIGNGKIIKKMANCLL